jgi:hypothetical protein
MNTETLIHELSLQALPVRPLAPPSVRFLKWLGVTLAFLILGIFAVGPRPDLYTAAKEPVFIVPAFIMAGLALICTFSAFVLARPDTGNARWEVVVWATLAAWAGVLAFLILNEDISGSAIGYICITRIAFFSVGPGILLFSMLRRAAPMRTAFVGLLAVMGALAFSEIAVQLLCRQSSLAHIVLWHFLPLCGLALPGLLIGRLIFR